MRSLSEFLTKNNAIVSCFIEVFDAAYLAIASADVEATCSLVIALAAGFQHEALTTPRADETFCV
jgi:hypothetical protein